jgi:hypothetical protein
MLSSVIDNMAQFLSAAPDPVLDAARIGDRVPATSGDLPGIAISLAEVGTRGSGMGSFRKEGHQLTQNTAIVSVEVGAGGFSTDRKSLQLPLPLRNPDDVKIGRVTGPNQATAYRITKSPATAEEFRVDPLRGQVIFGGPQTIGDKLAVTSWTLVFRNDITGDRSNGRITLETWSASAADASSLVRKLQSKLSDVTGLRSQGFAILQPAALGAAENVLYEPGTGSAFAVWRQQLTYLFHFDFEQGGEVSSGGPIQKINLNLPAEQEAFSVPADS